MIVPKPPFDFLETERRNRWMNVMIVLALLMTAVMTIVGRPLTTDVASAGILSYEFAWDMETAQAIVASWDANTKLVAAFSLGLDFLYPIVYASAISLGCVWAADRIRPSSVQVANVGVWLAWGAWLAALLDYVENVGLISILLGSPASFWPVVAFICAFVKFIVIMIAIFYVLAAAFVFRAKRPHTVNE